MKRFIRNTILFLLPVIAWNVYIVNYNWRLDPYGVIHQDMDRQYIEPNQRWLKGHFLIDQHARFNAYIFGSSRAGKIDPRNIDDEGNWYNFSYSEGLPVQHTEDLKLLLDNGASIDRVIIGLDNISFYVDPIIHQAQAPRKPYKNWHEPYLDYLFLAPDSEVKNEIERVKASSNKVHYDIVHTGMPDASFRDRWVSNDKQKHCSQPKFNHATWAFYYQARVEQALEEIASLLELCKENRIEAIFYMGPMHHTTYMRQDQEAYFDFIRGLARLTAFYDFSGLNEITTDNYYYYETSHFRPIVGDMMTEAMLDGTSSKFGRLVGPDNIEKVIQEKRDNWNAWLNWGK